MFGPSLGFKAHNNHRDAGFLRGVDIDGSFILPAQSLLHITYRSESDFLDTRAVNSKNFVHQGVHKLHIEQTFFFLLQPHTGTFPFRTSTYYNCFSVLYLDKALSTIQQTPL